MYTLYTVHTLIVISKHMYRATPRIFADAWKNRSLPVHQMFAYWPNVWFVVDISMKGLINQQRQLGGSSIRRSSATKKLCNSAPKAMALTRSFLGRSGPSQGHPTSQKGTTLGVMVTHIDPPSRCGGLKRMASSSSCITSFHCWAVADAIATEVIAVTVVPVWPLAIAEASWLRVDCYLLGGPPCCATDMTSIDLYLLCYNISYPHPLSI